MIPATFDYLAPTTVEEALSALAEHGDEAKVLAGGQSLLPVLRMRLNAPEVVVDLGRIDSLKGITEDGDTVTIGAMTTYADVLASDVVKEHLALLHEAVSTVADPQIRHRGTIGGACVHADPAGDVGPAVLALDGEFVITGSGGERTVGAADFFEDLFETAVGEGELLTGIRFRKHTGWGAAYEKFVRVSHQWSIVAVAATVKDGRAKIGLANMGATPLRAGAAEEAFASGGAEAAGAKAADGTNPPSDLNGDADYRRHLAGVLTRRALTKAAGG